jgi:lipooligosaccharide transport system permease protein
MTTVDQVPVRAGRAFAFWMAHYRRTFRGSLISTFLSPMLFLTAMGVGLGHYVHGGTGRVDGVRYAVFLAPGLLAASAMQTGIGDATWPVLGAIKWHRSYLAQLSTPLSVADVMFGHLLFMAVRISVVTVAFTVVMVAFGLAHSALGVALSLPAAVLTGLAFAAPVTAYAASQDRDYAFSLLYRFGLIPLFLFSGTFFPVSQLPAGLRPVAYVTPLWHGVALCRDLALGRGSAVALLGHAGYLLALMVIGAAVGLRTFRRRLRW